MIDNKRLIGLKLLTNLPSLSFQKNSLNRIGKQVGVQNEALGHHTLLVEIIQRTEDIAVNLICPLNNKTFIILGTKAIKMNCISFHPRAKGILQMAMST